MGFVIVPSIDRSPLLRSLITRDNEIRRCIALTSFEVVRGRGIKRTDPRREEEEKFISGYFDSKGKVESL